MVWTPAWVVALLVLAAGSSACAPQTGETCDEPIAEDEADAIVDLRAEVNPDQVDSTVREALAGDPLPTVSFTFREPGARHDDTRAAGEFVLGECARVRTEPGETWVYAEFTVGETPCTGGAVSDLRRSGKRLTVTLDCDWRGW